MRYRVLVGGVNAGVTVCMGTIEAGTAEEAERKYRQGRDELRYPWGCWLEETASSKMLSAQAAEE